MIGLGLVFMRLGVLGGDIGLGMGPGVTGEPARLLNGGMRLVNAGMGLINA